jgi:hypothetical protein
MRKALRALALTFLISHFSFFIAHAQWVSIPDTVFGSFLDSAFNGCMQGNNMVGWQMDTTCPAILNTSSLYCSHRPIRNLYGIQYFDNLVYLNFEYDSVNIFPQLPPLIESVLCEVNQISSIPSLPSTLTYLYCWTNQLTALPPLPPNLISLVCNENQLTSLPSLPNSLITLGCDKNQLTSLPTLPPGLTTLSCSYQPLGVLPALPSTLYQISCMANQLSSLPSLPAALQLIHCGGNNLTSLPALPPRLKSLYCEVNQLTALPQLPDSLYVLECSNNQLTSLPAVLPDSMFYLICISNPNLTCLPKLTRIVQLAFYGTAVTCVPNYGSVIGSSPNILTMPLCTQFNSNGCNDYWNISGRAYFDANANCARDSGDTSLMNVKLQLWSGGGLQESIYTGGEGYYSFDVDNFGNYEVRVDTSGIPFYVSCPANNLLLDTITALDSLDYNKDFALQCKPGFDLAAQGIWNAGQRPGEYSLIIINAGDISNLYGVHCANGVSGTVTADITGPANFLGAYLTPDSSTSKQVIWNVSDFGAINFQNTFNFFVQIDTTAPIGSQICINISLTPVAGDNNPANNSFSYCFIVAASYDPNNKLVYPQGDVDTSRDRWLTYTINFQNTGTAMARSIHIDDTLDTDLDASTFQLLSYSHQPIIQIKENVVRFNFPEINLPDSNTVEIWSHGHVQYKIKLKDNLPIGTQINNTAFIYFDFNSPVMTNTTTNTVAIISSLPSNSLKGEPLRIYPNPATEVVYIRFDESMIGGTATVSDIMGRKMVVVQLSTVNRQLSTADFSSGVYFVAVTDKEGRSATRKLIIQK